jgi:hypothetical protein
MNKDLMNELNDLLISAQVEIDNEPEKEIEYEKRPDGDYIGTIHEVELTESKSGKPMIKYTLKMDDGGGLEWKYAMLSSPMSAKITLQELNKFGVSGDNVEDFVEQFDKLLDVPVNIKIKTKNDYRNIYIKPA